MELELEQVQALVQIPHIVEMTLPQLWHAHSTPVRLHRCTGSNPIWSAPNLGAVAMEDVQQMEAAQFPRHSWTGTCPHTVHHSHPPTRPPTSPRQSLQ